MDTKVFETLELHKILDRLASRTSFSASRELALALQPSTELEEVQIRQRATSEACRLLSEREDLTIGGARDVRDRARAASRGAVLEPADLLAVQATLISSRKLLRYLHSVRDTFPALADIARGLREVPGLIDDISGAISDRADVVDGASDALANIRRDLRIARDRLNDKLQKMVGDPSIARMLQEPIITQREGRFVIPLRAEFKGKVKAVVHDQSSSGATLFIEPLVVVELNNRIRELELAERDEIRRILTELSGKVGDHRSELESTVEALADLDLALAKARYSQTLDGNEPELMAFASPEGSSHPGGMIKLLDARHPLLQPEEVVPIDFILDRDTYALVITGPNTGGKTVTLKTVGLLALMAQCGLHIPAASGSVLSVFQSVFADIGDEQSIEQSLSTFSSHISNITRILDSADRRSLVLLDELGAGTDPQEGAALAKALLDTFVEQGVMTLVATHFPVLKAYAHVTPGVANAHVEFDVQSLRPTYRLTIGLPGQSNALAIASRLGLDGEIIEKAREQLSPEELKAESLLGEIQQQREAARKALKDAEAARRRVQELEHELSQRLEGIETERVEILEQARREGQAELQVLKDELESLRRKLSLAAQPLEVVDQVKEQLKEVSDQVEAPVQRGDRAPSRIPETFHLGDRVQVESIGSQGVITSMDGEQAEIQVGRLRVRAGLEELRPVSDQVKDPSADARGEVQSGDRVVNREVGSAPPLELDLRGSRVEEALVELERRLDSAYLANLPFVRIIHGKGTGRLREAVRDFLRGNPYVGDFRPGEPSEGGDGVTVVRLASSG